MTSPQPATAALQALVLATIEEMIPSDATAPNVQVDRSKAGFSSDFQTPAALQLAKVLRRSPRDIAADLAAKLTPRLGALAEAPDVSGPGFIGFRLSDDALQGYLEALSAAEHLGLEQAGGEHIVIDYSSPNVAKRMHVGHIRSTIIGDALARMGRALGYRVIADNHIGDWGTQFGQIIYAWDHWLDPAAYDSDPVGELQRIYIKFQTEAKEDASLMDAARAELAKLQAGDERNLALWKQFIAASRHVFDAVYDRLGVVFDVTNGESHYNDMLIPLVDKMHDEGRLIAIDGGALAVAFGDQDIERPKRMVVRKSDGAATYATTDLATVFYREQTWAPMRCIYVTDSRQKEHFQHVFSVVRDMDVTTDLQHVMFGIMSSPEGSLSTRAGNAIPLDELLDEATRRARASLEERLPADFDGDKDALAEMIGLGAVKYSDLSNNPASNIVFSWDKMLSFEGNTAPYLQYTSARTHSLLAKAAAAGLEPDGTTLKLADPLERDLLLHLMDFGPTVRAAFDQGKPNTLASWLYDVASKYHSWYAACPVLRSEDRELQISRLNLTRLAQRMLVRGLDLLGIGAPQRM
ncbi:MAG: arginine--tRNA ligase [Proteobacteria bacterium]|nr:arginine--tRNA ligase [Pseudomonadota bacterium]